MAEVEKTIEDRLTVVREYLLSRISQCRVVDGPATPHERTLMVTFGASGRRTVRVSTALLADSRLDSLHLAEGLEKNDIARQVLATPGFYLDAETVRSKPPR
jgi:hypothetical protein